MKTASLILTSFLLASLVTATHLQPTWAEESVQLSYPILSGVGMTLRVSDGSIYISKILPDSVAEKSKSIHEGDQLLSVQNDDKCVSVQGKPFGDVVSMIRGPVGTKVTLEVQPKEQKSSVKITLTRKPIRIAGATNYQEFIGKKAPNLSFSSHEDSKVLKLSNFRGKIVVLDFWASWCGSCYPPIDELQKVARSHPEWKDRVVLISVSVDIESDKAAKIILKRGWNQTINLSTDYETLKSIGVQALPVLLIVLQDGTIAVMGASHAIDVEKRVEKLLAPNIP